MKHPKINEDKINKFLEIWSQEDISEFISQLDTLCHVFSDEDDPDWLDRIGGHEKGFEVKIITAVHIISRLSHLYAGKMCITKSEVPHLFLDLERSVEQEKAKKNDNND